MKNESVETGAGRFPGWDIQPGRFTRERDSLLLRVKWQRDYRWSVSRGGKEIKAGVKPSLSQAIARCEQAANDIVEARL